MSEPVYKRGQVEWALWRAFLHARSPGDGPPAIFKTRIKRLLDLDRVLKPEDFLPAPPGTPAFLDSLDGGSGIEAAYRPFDAFCLGIALDLLDVGFKQQEIVCLMRHLRADLEEWFPDLVARPSLIDRQRHLASQHPHLPVIERGGGRAPQADARVFMIMNRVEMTEMMPGLRDSVKPGQAAFLAPEYCVGVVELQHELDELLPHRRRTVIVIELAFVAQAVSTYLKEAPAMPRGRPRRISK